VTRHSKWIQETLLEASEIEGITKSHEALVNLPNISSQLHQKGKSKTVIPQDEHSVEELKRKLKLANLEIAKLKKASRKHAIQQANFNRMKALWEDKTSSIPEVVDCNAQFYTWTVPAIKEAKFIRMINMQLRVGTRVMKRQIEDLKMQLSQQKKIALRKSHIK